MARSGELRSEIIVNLDAFVAAIRSDHLRAGVEGAVSYMAKLHCDVDEHTWEEVVRTTVIAHELHQLMLEDPYTGRAFRKPRGYAGDAEIMDYLYYRSPPASASKLGQQMFAITTVLPNSISIADRRHRIARLIDRAAAEKHRPVRVLAVASGHLREAELSSALLHGAVSEIVALDQDLRTLEVFKKDYARLPIKCAPQSIQRLLIPRPDLGKFDVIYSAGMYNYLPDALAWRLTSNLFDRLNPGGTLMACNFLPGNANRAFMESFMDWRVVMRDETQMMQLVSELPAGQIGERLISTDAGKNIAYLEIMKG
ncbi:MAG: class I SAM-dependent methyltransferase [Burkholderiales bacterium]|nr:class I SAM-dependent methyltransferase [Burkholderiales bacterium]